MAGKAKAVSVIVLLAGQRPIKDINGINNSSMRKLEQPRGLVINFNPSPKQYKVWQTLQGGVCDKCGAPLELKLTGHDHQGHPIHEAVCSLCGNTDIPELVLAGGSARRG